MANPYDYAGALKAGWRGGRQRGYVDQGDYESAATEALPYDPAQAKTYLDVGDRADQKAYGRDYAGAYARNDFPAMETAAVTAGDPSGVATARSAKVQVDDRKKAEAKQRIENYLAAGQSVRDANSYATWREQVKAQEAQAGDDPAMIDQLFPADWRGPETFKGGVRRVLGLAKAMDIDIDLAKTQQADAKLALDDRRVGAAEMTANAAMLRAEQAANGGGASGNRDFTRESSLRDDFRSEPVVKGYREVKAVFDRTQAYLKRAGAKGAPVGDIGMVFALAKINDPTSVVREQEFAQIAMSGGYGQQIKNLVSQAQGRGFDPSTRAQLWTEINSAYKTYEKNYGDVRNQYADLARRGGVDPRNIVLDIETPLAQVEPDVAPSGTAFDELPPAEQFKGATIKDKETNKEYVSDGARWAEKPAAQPGGYQGR